MAIRIVNDGNTVLGFTQSFADECVIESTMITDKKTGELMSHVKDIKNGEVVRGSKRMHTDSEVSDHIAELASNGEIGSIETVDGDIIIHLRELGADGIELENIQ